MISTRIALFGAAAGKFALGKWRAEAIQMKHVILLGDSVFDNAAYVARGPDVRQQLADILPPGFRATLLARDGAVISGVIQQLKQLPMGATHLAISAGGNDALQAAGVLEDRAISVADALKKLSFVCDGFATAYGSLLDAVAQRNLPTAVCTIYQPRFPDVERRRTAAAALTLFNDLITFQAFSRRIALIDLRIICSQDQDFANPIEPSTRGGLKISNAIRAFAIGEPPFASVFARI